MSKEVKHMGMPHTSIDTNAKSQTRAYYMSAGGQKRWLGPWRNCIEDAEHDQDTWTAKHNNGEAPTETVNEKLREALRAVRQELNDLHLAIADQGIEERFIDDRVNMLSEGQTAIEKADAALALANS